MSPRGEGGGTPSDSQRVALQDLAAKCRSAACGWRPPYSGRVPAGFKGSALPFEGEYLQLISSVAETTNQSKSGCWFSLHKIPQRPLQLFRGETFALPRPAPRGEAAGRRARQYERITGCRESFGLRGMIQLQPISAEPCTSGHCAGGGGRWDDAAAITSFSEELSGKIHIRDQDKHPPAIPAQAVLLS